MKGGITCLPWIVSVSLVLPVSLGVAVAGPRAETSWQHGDNDAALIDRFRDILEHPVPFQSTEEEAMCKDLVAALNDEQVTLAARTSYAYWYLDQQNDECNASHLKWQSAMREARRHLVASNGDFTKALHRLQEACQYRKEHKLDALRTCFSGGDTLDDQKSDIERQMLEWISNDMSSQPVIMKGHDREERAVLFKGSRQRKGGTTKDEYLMTQLYIAERANACAEFISRGRQEKMVAIFDFSTYQSGYSPPLKWQLSAIRVVQQLYPERLHKLILLEPPLWMRGVYHGIRSFLPHATQQKIQLVQDRNDLSSHLDMTLSPNEDSDDDSLKENTSTLMKSELIGVFDLEHYLKGVPFFCPYDCENYYPNSTNQQQQ